MANLFTMIHGLSDAFWRSLFSISPLRDRVTLQVKHRCLRELGFCLPLGRDVWIPWFDQEIGSSFAEIFLEQEYSGLFAFMNPPTRWVDLGAFAGFFSAWLLWNGKQIKPRPPFEALLIDADMRSAPLIADLVRINNVSETFRFRHGAIAAGIGSCPFVQVPYMSSSLASLASPAAPAVDVPVVTSAEIMSAFPPPYDLVKVDIEGAEYELLQGYGDFLLHCEYLLLEWHSWHSGGGGFAQLQELAGKAGFCTVADLRPARDVSKGQTGVTLFRRAGSHRAEVHHGYDGFA